MLVLGIDTAARRGGVALAQGDRILASRRIEAPKGFGDTIYPLIEDLLQQAGVALADVELFAAASGPGSFTGVRVGLTAAKALGEALGRPAVGVSNLAAMAAAAGEAPCAPVLDARREEVYGAVFGEGGEPLLAESVLPWSRLLEQAAGFDPLWVAADARVFGPEGAAPLPEGASSRTVDDIAAAIARLAPGLLAQGEGAPERVEANYIRRPDAERNWKG